MSTVLKTISGFRDRNSELQLSRQRWLRRYVRVFWILLVSQAACLALGLWMESQLIGSIKTAEQKQESRTFSPPKDARLDPATGDSWTPYLSTIAMKIMAFLWIAALQATAAYLVLSRVFAEAARMKVAATGEALRRQRDLLRTRDAVIFGLAKLAESRDFDTGNHLERIVLYSTRLSTALQRYPEYQTQVNSTFVKLIGISSALHDIGKVGVRDSILLKPGRLNATEQALMEQHAEIGGKCIRDIELRLGSSNFLQMARQIAFSHHERFDGSGYPKGLIGEEIPLPARIVAICDVYDALSAHRIYKGPMPHEDCVRIIRNGAGSHFDPGIIDVFLEIHSEFREIASRYANPAAKRPKVDGPAPDIFDTIEPASDEDPSPAFSTELLPG